MELTAAEVWTRMLERARKRISEQNYRIWLEPAEPLALSQDLLAVAAGSEFAAEWLEDKYGELLGDVSEELFNRRLTLSFQHHPQHSRQAPRPADTGEPPSSGAGGGASSSGSGAGSGASGVTETAGDGPRAPSIGAPLNERYTFERFVVGSSNQLAVAACRAVADAPARMYNPLFIYGGVGLGKTHLMHAIGHTVLDREPDKRVAYISTERFTNELIVSIQEGRMARFRRRYRQIDVLLIDDVHFLAEKERTQEEFFHTFNALYDAQRQIVVTSDRPPKDIPGLEERLVSRFEWGLVSDIKAPDFETRVAILRKKADEDNLIIADQVLEFIAHRCRSSVRELEGATIKLLAYSSLTRREITIDLAREALGAVLSEPESAVELSPESIRAAVAERWDVPEQGLISKRRTKELTVPRQVAMYLMRDLLDISLVDIGKAFGGRDHSTVIHSIQKVEKELESDDDFRQRVTGIRARFAAET